METKPTPIPNPPPRTFAPLFVLWAVRGDVVPDRWTISICGFFAVMPTFLLWWKMKIARKNEKRQIAVGDVVSYQGHVLTYLFATLLPFYRTDLSTERHAVAALLAFGMIVFLFWRLNLHYANIYFALRKYYVFSVALPVDDDNPISDRGTYVLITRRPHVYSGTYVKAYRLSTNVYMEEL